MGGAIDVIIEAGFVDWVDRYYPWSMIPILVWLFFIAANFYLIIKDSNSPNN